MDISDDPWQMGQATQHWQRAMLRHAAEEITYREGAKVICFGHTHFSSQEVLNNRSIYINTGSWVNDFSEASLEIWQELFEGGCEYRPTPTRLPYARIDYDEHDNPTAKLLYFKHEETEVSQAPNIDLAVSTQQQSPSGLFFKRKFGRLVRLLGAAGSG
jgi:hypothetical protein